jgi:hypothetical protein
MMMLLPLFILIFYLLGVGSGIKAVWVYTLFSILWTSLSIIGAIGSAVQTTPSKICIDSDSVSGWIKEGAASRTEIMKTVPFSAIVDVKMSGWWGPTTVTNANLWTVGVLGTKELGQPFILTRENALRVKEAWEAWKKRQGESPAPKNDTPTPTDT